MFVNSIHLYIICFKAILIFNTEFKIQNIYVNNYFFTAKYIDAKDEIKDHTKNSSKCLGNNCRKKSSLVKEGNIEPMKTSAMTNDEVMNENSQPPSTSCQMPLDLSIRRVESQETSAILTNGDLQSTSIWYQIPGCPLDLSKRTVQSQETSSILSEDISQSPSTAGQILEHPLNLTETTVPPQETLTDEHFQSPSTSHSTCEHLLEPSNIKQEEDYCTEEETNILPQLDFTNVEDIKEEEEYEEMIIVTSDQNGENLFYDEKMDVVSISLFLLQ